MASSIGLIMRGNTLFQGGEVQVLDRLDLLEELVEHTGLGEELDTLQGQRVVLILYDVLLRLQIQHMQLQHGTNTRMLLNKTHPNRLLNK